MSTPKKKRPARTKPKPGARLEVRLTEAEKRAAEQLAASLRTDVSDLVRERLRGPGEAEAAAYERGYRDGVRRAAEAVGAIEGPEVSSS